MTNKQFGMKLQCKNTYLLKRHSNEEHWEGISTLMHSVFILTLMDHYHLSVLNGKLYKTSSALLPQYIQSASKVLGHM